MIGDSLLVKLDFKILVLFLRFFSILNFTHHLAIGWLGQIMDKTFKQIT